MEDKKLVGKTPTDNWRIRRRFMFGISAFCIGTILYVLIWGKEGSVAETAITMSFTTLIAITGSYCFAATWDDITKGGM